MKIYYRNQQRRVINERELKSIKDKIFMNKFCLTPLLSDNEEIDCDDLEKVALSLNYDDINIISISKEKVNYRRTDYFIHLNINNYAINVKNWFTYDKRLDIFEDEDVYADNYC